MPNYCNNTLIIKGKLSEIDEFITENTSASLSHIKTNDKEYPVEISLDFEKILPTPKKANGEIIDDWYKWRLKNWGTKWNICDSYYFKVKEIGKDEVELVTSFTTAWTYPEGIYSILVDRYKDTSLQIDIEYYESGMGFAGEATYLRGQETYSHYVEYTPKSYENNVKYYAYIIEKEHENIDWIEDQIIESSYYEDDEIEQVCELLDDLYKNKNYEEIAKMYLKTFEYN